jgi:serine/threonine-protein kinase RsbW
MGSKHTLTIPGRYEKIQQVCHFVAQGAVQAGLGESAVFHIELACDEACTNVIEHAYGGEDVGEIEVSWQVTGKQFVLTIHDHGRPFDPSEVLPPPDYSDPETGPLNNSRTGGLGVHFMRKLMDEVTFHFDGEGNTVTLVKKITGEVKRKA